MPTLSQRRESASIDLEKKLRLEKPLAVQVRTILRNMATDLANGYSATGVILDAKHYEDDFVAILRPSYRKAEKQFGNYITDRLETELDNDNPDKPQKRSFLLAAFHVLASRGSSSVEDRIAKIKHEKNDRLFDFTTDTVPKRAALITSTNQEEINRAIARAAAEIIAEGKAFNVSAEIRVDVANRAGQIFKDSSLYRGAMIATTEIQNASEGAKAIEASAYDEALSPLEADGTATIERLKEWHTQGDEKVRPAHVLADLQQVQADEPFNVDGEDLMYPGDSSLGASPGNTINCRCSAIYTVDGNIEKIVTAESDTGSFL